MAGRITAVLGPTNTGKTHYAIERMLAHRTGVIGLPLRLLAREVYDSVLDLVSGVYPSTDFAELKPRVVYDRVTGVMTARPGAQRVAVTSGGTIPDRGMFGVFLYTGSGEGSGGAPRRVGELDEEMVYESRVGDVFTLGATSWRIEDITRDQVLVTPAPGQVARLPFWKGDALSRPLELGEAIGAFTRQMAETSDEDALTRARELGLDELAARKAWLSDRLAELSAEERDILREAVRIANKILGQADTDVPRSRAI